MNPSSKSQPKPNKTSTAQAEPSTQPRKAAGKPAATTEPKAKTGKKAKALKSAPAPETTQAANKPAPKKTKVPTIDKKPKLVHDSYSLPKDEDVALGALKRRAVALGLDVKKNSLLRAGLLTLGQLGDAALLAALRALPEPARAAASDAAPKPAKTQLVKTKAPKPDKAGKADKAAKPAKAAKRAQAAAPQAQADATQAP